MSNEEEKKLYLAEIQDRIRELRKLRDEMPEHRRAVSYGVVYLNHSPKDHCNTDQVTSKVYDNH